MCMSSKGAHSRLPRAITNSVTVRAARMASTINPARKAVFFWFRPLFVLLNDL